MEEGLEAQGRGERNSSGAPAPLSASAPTPRPALSPGVLGWRLHVLLRGLRVLGFSPSRGVRVCGPGRDEHRARRAGQRTP